MWLHEYLKARADLSGDAEQSPKSSLECLIKWSTFSGFRSEILNAASKFLKTIQDDYMQKFHRMPENILTRSMIFFGLVIGPIAPIPMLIIDFAVLLAMFVVFSACWGVGGALTIIVAGLGWIVGGSKAMNSIFEHGTKVTEDLTFFVLNLLRIPAGALNLIGLLPSFILETATEGLNYAAVSAAYGAYNCNPTNYYTTGTHATNRNSYEVSRDPIREERRPTMLNSFDPGAQARIPIAEEVLEEAETDDKNRFKFLVLS